MQIKEKKPTVAILMSTYNGEKYLRQQLDSIFAQEDVSIKLIVRDDGSSDRTRDILNEYKGITVMAENNIGCEESFKKLLYLPIEADYYAFADQDDVWHPRKLISAINILSNTDAELYVCNLMLADGDLNLERPLFSKKDIERINYKFKNYVLGNLHGCVQVWSDKLHNIIQSYVPLIMYGHDAWVNAIANMVYSTYIDENCYINYRLHGNNTSGLARNNYQKIKKGLTKYLRSNSPSKYILCKDLLKGFGHMVDISNKRYETICLISNYKDSLINKIKLLTAKFINVTDFEHRCLNWISIIINRY
ncbi:MAG: glycosyltransferase [Muribaculaceae bacterium]|nr:glycosyltransferase [Muribaculaceae bacterium]